MDSDVTATGEAHVGQQVGVQLDGAVLHDATFYTYVSGDSPDHRQDVARAHIDGGSPRQAEEILRDLVMNGHATTERAYLYVLSVLSDRPFTDITAEQSRDIRIVMSMAAKEPRDDWQEALEVVDRLLRYAIAEFGQGSVEQELASALQMFGALNADRQDEIARHMDLILGGAVQERLTGERKHQVAVERMSGNRARRAWKFFEADPRPPAKWLTPPTPSSVADWRDAVFGSVALALAMGSMLLDGITVISLIGVVSIVVGCCLAIRCTTVWQTHVRHTDSAWANCVPRPDLQETEFGKLVDKCFRDGDSSGLWEISAGYRECLKRRLQQQYDADDCRSAELKWLIMWHDTRFGRQYYYPTAESSGTQRAANLRIIGLVVWGSVPILLAGIGHFMALLLAVGGWWGIRGIARIRSVSRVRGLLDQDAEVLLTEELTEYYWWIQALADRPTDAEMARWLALDKTHLKNDALRRANLRERDLVTHVVMTERAPYARKARFIDGPPRYEAYLVHVFLLTQYGMRTTRTYLNFTTGDVRNEQRQMCTYDAVASASVVEKGIRKFRADGHPSTDNLTKRAFRLILLNGTCIAEVREYSRETGDGGTVAGDEPEDARYAQFSAFESALQIFEAVATEGRDWIARDRERRQRWARNWCTSSPSAGGVRTGVTYTRTN
ncbi:hypothetical protein [Nocardia sp. IFM 10818]